MKTLKQIISTSKIVFFLYAIVLTNSIIGMEEKIHTITVHNKLPSKFNTNITVIEVRENSEHGSYGGTMTDILPEKSERFIKNFKDEIAELTIKVGKNNTYNPMVINIKIEEANENIYITTSSKKCEEVTISNSTQKLITLYAINKKQNKLNTK